MKTPVIEPNNLKTEYAKDPLGIQPTNNIPRFSWESTSPVRNQMQTAYQIMVSSDRMNLDNDKADMWNSGKVLSSQSNDVNYSGKSLESGKRYCWKIKVWDRNKTASNWSSPAWFEMGLLHAADWQGKWIGRNAFGSIQLRKQFTVNKTIKRARAYSTGIGYYELYMNGSKVGNRVLEPAVTKYNKTVLYSVYDVSSYLLHGENVVGAVLGGGWGACHEGDYWRASWFQSQAHDYPKLLLQLEIEYEDETKLSVVSDDSWKIHPSPTVDDLMHYGDTYDARAETPGWEADGFDASVWTPAAILSPASGKLVAQVMPPVRVIETLNPVSITNPAAGVYVFKFERNIAGWTELKVRGSAGTIVSLQHSEKLLPNGRISTVKFGPDKKGLDGRTKSWQTNYYILKGEGTEIWEPRFTYHGFQYVEVTGFPGTPDLDSINAKVVHADLESTGSFCCSHDLINNIHDLTRKTILNNAQGYNITDCPAYEKMSWLGDGLLTAQTALYNFDMTLFYEKWVNDQADQVISDGHIGGQAPRGMDDGKPGGPYPRWGADWEGCFLLMPWEMYLNTGSKRHLTQYYDKYKLHTDYEIHRVKNNINESFWGDHLAPDNHKIPRITGTAYTFKIVQIMAALADIVKNSADKKIYAKHANAVKKGFNEVFLDTEKQIYREPSDSHYHQTANLLPLAWDIIPPEYLAGIKLNLIKHSHNIDTGIHGTKYLLPVLSDIGAVEEAFKLATRSCYPSWGYWISLGATSLWEDWPGTGRSRNHHAFGSIDEWFYAYLAGIKPISPGYKKSQIKPHIPDKVNSVEARIHTIHGILESKWLKKRNSLILNIKIPVNTTASVSIIGSNDREICEGGIHPASKAPGVKYMGVTADGYVEYLVGSGNYVFSSSKSHLQQET